MAVHVTGLRKAYGEKVVLDGIDGDVATGTIFALLGANGAGKTTTIKILSTLIGADSARSGSRATTRPATATTCALQSV
jgi:ABC-2 type transport system ATP-binding protein